jgi:hypothetical protein
MHSTFVRARECAIVLASVWICAVAFRRYLVTGQHVGISRNYMTLNGMRVSLTENPMKISSSIIHEQFDKAESAHVHVLPPNTDVNELSSLELNQICLSCMT